MIKKQLKLALLLFCLVTFGAAQNAFAETVTISATDAGIYSSSGFSSAINTSYFVGRSSTTGNETRNFFVFDLTSIPLGTTSATLLILNPAGGFVGTDASNTVTFYDVVTPVGTLTAGSSSGAAGQAIFTDLGSGLTYGSLTVTPADNGQVLAVQLNAAAIAAINLARGGLFAIGGALTTLSPTGADGLFSGSGIGSNTQAVRLVVSNDAPTAAIPEPTTLALLGTGLAGLYARRRRQPRA